MCGVLSRLRLALPEHFPLQQGLKQATWPDQKNSTCLPEHFPLQQGLKLLFSGGACGVRVSSWALSITTRIETWTKKLMLRGGWASWALSITTRIETLLLVVMPPAVAAFLSTFHYNKDWNTSMNKFRKLCASLPEHFPLQQGLKRRIEEQGKFWKAPSWALSITTRIETCGRCRASRPGKSLPEHFPLQQGLKPGRGREAPEGARNFLSTFHYNKDWNDILFRMKIDNLDFLSTFHYNKDWNPRIRSRFHLNLRFLSTFHYNKDWNMTVHKSKGLEAETSWALSITTRIETIARGTCVDWSLYFLSTFHYNKDWNPFRYRGRPTPNSFLSTFHYNKDWNTTHCQRTLTYQPLPEHFPLQQGLKRRQAVCADLNSPPSWALSITTRIETDPYHGDRRENDHFLSTFHYNKDWNEIRADRRNTRWYSSWALSITTRIETYVHVSCKNLGRNFLSTFHYNKDWNYIEFNFEDDFDTLPEHFPLQQGLKPSRKKAGKAHSPASWALSITTRIETLFPLDHWRYGLSSWALSITTRIETRWWREQ